MTSMPGRSYTGALQFSREEQELATRLRAHVEALAATPRNTDLDTAARYIAAQFPTAREQQFQSRGRTVRNI